jgi:4-hydroxy-3-polyprenylbenzoate decarboxylase
MRNDNQVTLAISGASGAQYALTLLQQLLAANQSVHLMVSDAAKVVFATEVDLNIPSKPEAAIDCLRDTVKESSGNLNVYSKKDWFSPVASGSSAPSKMVICPCSTGTLSSVATGASENLIERAADVIIKERGQLILVPREMPFSSIHLENMLKLSNIGVTIMPANPGFYHQPESVQDMVNFVVGRILDHLCISQSISKSWGYQST